MFDVIIPIPALLFAICVPEDTLALTQVFFKPTLVRFSIAPFELAGAVAHVFVKLAVVPPAVIPNEWTIPVHHVVQPLACVGCARLPDQRPFALPLAHEECTVIRISIAKYFLSKSVFFALELLAILDVVSSRPYS